MGLDPWSRSCAEGEADPEVSYANPALVLCTMPVATLRDRSPSSSSFSFFFRSIIDFSLIVKRVELNEYAWKQIRHGCNKLDSFVKLMDKISEVNSTYNCCIR